MLALVCEIADRAGGIILDLWGRAGVRYKADHSPVTDADLAAEAFILEELGRRFPDHGILAEEQAAEGGVDESSPFCWVVDPLDGTRNFTRGFPCFCTSIALTENGLPTVGVIREHCTGRSYTAIKGGGAMLDGTRLKVVDRPLDRDFFVGVPSIKRDESPAVIRGILERINVRNIGSTAAHLALLSAGAIDAVYCRRCYAWDIAAGCLLITEAGGVCTGPDGRPCWPFAGGSSKVKPW